MNSQFQYMAVTKDQLGKLDAGQWCVKEYSKLLGIYWVVKPEPKQDEENEH